jgi:hydroxymethylpyrimidine pyrophosphatase-like HAD family hydrolase
MRYLLLATDYDGTLASHGRVSESTLAALKGVPSSGRKLVLVTGRHLRDLISIFPDINIFHRVVAENGAILYRPDSREGKLLCEAPNPRFIQLLAEREIPVSVGQGIVATWEPHQGAVLSCIRDLGLDLQVIFNKGAVMILPSGVNKGTGLDAAIKDLGLSKHNVLGFGDAENDHAFLAMCECSVAVANSVGTLKDRADIVTQSSNGKGVEEVIAHLLEDDLARYDSRLERHAISLGCRTDNEKPVLANPHRNNIMVAGPSASGKSTAVSGILEQLAEHQYQFCLLDPEGDFENFAGALTLGTAKEIPDPKAVMRALEAPFQSVVVNLIDVPMADRPEYGAALLPQLLELRARTARPHWLVFDEAHHLLPTSWSPASNTIPTVLEATILITVHPDHVSVAALTAIDILLVTGKAPMETLRAFAKALGTSPPQGDDVDLKTGEALVWFRKQDGFPVRVRTTPGKAQRKRHLRQYAEGELSPPQSFYFRGPESKLNLRAHNLNTFIQLAEGVDDQTWIYHLQQGDYSRWFREVIKDDSLANDAAAVETNGSASPEETRRAIRDAIETRYTIAA